MKQCIYTATLYIMYEFQCCSTTMTHPTPMKWFQSVNPIKLPIKLVWGSTALFMYSCLKHERKPKQKEKKYCVELVTGRKLDVPVFLIIVVVGPCISLFLFFPHTLVISFIILSLFVIYSIINGVSINNNRFRLSSFCALQKNVSSAHVAHIPTSHFADGSDHLLCKSVIIRNQCPSIHI